MTQKYYFITMRDNEQMYVWRDGCYRPCAEALIKEEYKNLGEEYGANRVKEVNLDTMELKPHSPEYMFFNLLPVEYNPDAGKLLCPCMRCFFAKLCRGSQSRKSYIRFSPSITYLKLGYQVAILI